MKLVKYKSWKCYLEFGEYPNGRKAIELMNAKDGDPVLVATVNLPNEFIELDEVIIKTYSENDGVLEVLINAGVVSAPIRFIESGMIRVPVCKVITTT